MNINTKFTTLAQLLLLASISADNTTLQHEVETPLAEESPLSLDNTQENQEIEEQLEAHRADVSKEKVIEHKHLSIEKTHLARKQESPIPQPELPDDESDDFSIDDAEIEQLFAQAGGDDLLNGVLGMLDEMHERFQENDHELMQETMAFNNEFPETNDFSPSFTETSTVNRAS